MIDLVKVVVKRGRLVGELRVQPLLDVGSQPGVLDGLPLEDGAGAAVEREQEEVLGLAGADQGRGVVVGLQDDVRGLADNV